MDRGFVSGNKNGGGAVGLGLHFEGQNYQYFKRKNSSYTYFFENVIVRLAGSLMPSGSSTLKRI
jgi:hypothetical protein